METSIIFWYHDVVKRAGLGKEYDFWKYFFNLSETDIFSVQSDDAIIYFIGLCGN